MSKRAHTEGQILRAPHQADEWNGDSLTLVWVASAKRCAALLEKEDTRLGMSEIARAQSRIGTNRQDTQPQCLLQLP